MSSNLQNLHVLIVEDTMTQAMMIQHVLDKAGVRVTIARSGEKAIRQLANPGDTPQLVLCDVNMPEMSGYELCKKLKGDATTSGLPFILLSTLVDTTDLLRVLDCGADNFIYKTFEGDYFLQRLSSIWTACCAEIQADVSVKASIFSENVEHRLEISGQRLANLLVSSFETAVFHTKSLKANG